VAWYLGSVPGGASGTLTFAILVDGAGADLADGTPIPNSAFFGVNEGSLPSTIALTSSAGTTVLAPTITTSKADGQATAGLGEALTYNLHITNSGSIAAAGLLITDELPADVVYSDGSANPSETRREGQTLIWEGLGAIAAGDDLTIDIPVNVAPIVPNGTELINTMMVKYENNAGHVYALETAADTTTVEAPELSISKSDSPDPVLTGNGLTYVLDYANSGPVEATGVVITDRVPAGTIFDGCSGGTGCGLLGGDVVSWTIGAVPPDSGGSVGFSALVDVALGEGDIITNDDYGIIADQTDYVPGAAMTTTVSQNAGYIDGYAFVDADGNGQKDGTESGLGGIDVTVAGATILASETTDGSGYYRIRVEAQEPISVTAAPVAGYYRTTPGTVLTNTMLGVTQTVSFGYAEDSAPFAVVYGTVYEDANHDGIRDLGENGIQGVTITSTEAAPQTVLTNEYGQYTLHYDSDGPVTITEEGLPFYISTTPDVVPTTAVVGSSGPSPVNFGEFAGVEIVGQVFADENTNGVNDDGVPISGAVVSAGGEDFTTTLAGNGVYTLYATVTGSPITILETDPAGYVSSNAVPGSGMTRVDANTLEIADPLAGTIYTDGDFGDVMASSVVTISGQVWNDNGDGGIGAPNGSLDGTESGLAGAVVSLSSGMTQTTGADGLFLLYAPPDLVITVAEKNPDGYVSTNAIPGNDAIKLDNDTLIVGPLGPSQTSAGNLFGDVLASSAAIITGTVFDDANENGVQDGGETGMAGVTVTLEISGSDAVAVNTDAEGGYEFSVAPGSDVRITAKKPGDAYYPTTPESIILRPPASGVYPNNNFGYSDDVDVSVISGIVFDDADGNGKQDFGEPGLAGAVITLDGADSVTTGGNGLISGTFQFVVTEAGVHSLREQNPAGYRSTTPDDINVPVELGGSYHVEFGDTNSSSTASLYGTVFDDLDGDGVQDGDEPLMSGVVISVTTSSGVTTTTSKAYGQYGFGFSFSEAGYHTVREQNPARPGYHSTTPDELILYVVAGESYAMNFGDTMSNSSSSVTGVVFDDDNGDGTQNPSELGLSGVLVSLSTGAPTTTDANGGYTLAVTETGYIEVIEQDPFGFHSTTPNNVAVEVAALGEVYAVDFGDSDNAAVSSIFGTVFEDLDADGSRAATEPGLSGITVTISSSPNPYLTNEFGQFTFLVDSAGTYTITQTDPAGYVSTAAVPGSASVTVVDDNTLRAQVEVGVDVGDNLFGDVARTLEMTKTAEDLNGAPLYAGDEIEYTITVTNTSTTYTQTNVTISDTAPASTTLVLDSVACSAGAICGASSGIVTATVATLAPSEVLTLTFGATVDTGATTIGGNVAAVHSDQQPEQETDPVFPPGGGDVEPGLVIAKSAADVDGPPLYPGDAIEYSITVTNTSPIYSQTNVAISDTVPGGTTFVPDSVACSQGATCGESAGVVTATVATLGSGEVFTLTFSATVDDDATTISGNVAGVESDNQGEQRTDPVFPPGAGAHAIIFGVVFDDADGDGVRDPGESGIPDVLITLDDTETTTTGSDGSYAFATTTAGAHAVVETDPPGYTSTTPNAMGVDAILGEQHRVDFGDQLETPCTCAKDAYEEDDVPADAKVLEMGIANKQAHNFCDDATDWLKFTAQEGDEISITISAWGQRADTILAIYGANGQTELASNDDYVGAGDGSSQVVWIAPANGEYHVLVTNAESRTGCDTDYEIWAERQEGGNKGDIYLPLVVRWFTPAP
jgi:uncharacterized repeat protein (TIGR01451 family)